MRTAQRFSEVVEQYVVWLEANRTEEYARRQERLLREHVLPVFGESSLDDVLESCMISPLTLAPAQQKPGLAAIRAANNVVGWYLKKL